MSEKTKGSDRSSKQKHIEYSNKFGRRDYLKVGGASIGASILGFAHGTEPAAASTTSSGGRINLSPEVPQWAVDLRDNAPDTASDRWSTVDGTHLEGRNGDLASEVESNAGSAIVDIGSGGTYEWSSTVSGTSSPAGVIGDVDNPPVIKITTTGDAWDGTYAGDVAMEGVIFDITETTDVCLYRSYPMYGDFFCKSVTLVGERAREVTGGSNSKDTVIPQVADGYECYVEDLVMTDGEDDRNWPTDDLRAYAIPVSMDSSHEGEAVFIDCDVRNWLDNGFYVRGSPGRVCLWDCVAYNNGRGGNMRVGDNDWIIGGHSEINLDKPHGRDGSLLANDAGQWQNIVGLTMVGEGDGYGNAGMQLWSGGDDNPEAEGGPMDRCVFHFKSGNSMPIRVDSKYPPHVTMTDTWILDESSQAQTIGVSEEYDNGGELTLDGDMQIDSNSTDTISVGSLGTLNVGGTSYGEGDYDASEFGMDASLTPDDFPTFYFDYEDGNGGGSGDGPIDLGTDNNANSTSNENGIHFEAKQEIDSVQLTISQKSEGFTTCRLRDATSKDVVAERDVSHLQAGDTFEIGPDDGLNADTYLVTLDADGSEWTRGRFEDPSYPYSNDALTVIEGVYSSGGTPTEKVRYSFTEIAVGDGSGITNGIDLGTDNNANTSSNENGIHFEAKRELPGVRVAISQNSEGFTTCRLRDATSKDLLLEKDVSDLQAGDTFEMAPAGGLEADTYLITLDADGSEWTRGRFEDPSYPYSNEDLTVIEGIYSSGGTPTEKVRYSFTAIAATDGPETGDGLDLGTDNNANATTNENGIHFEAEQELDGIQLTISQNSDGFTTCRLRDATSKDLVAEKDVSDLQAGDTFNIIPEGGLDADTYLITLGADGSEWTRGRFEDPSYPYSNSDFTVLEGIYSSGGTPTEKVRYSFTAIAGIYTV